MINEKANFVMVIGPMGTRLKDWESGFLFPWASDEAGRYLPNRSDKGGLSGVG